MLVLNVAGPDDSAVHEKTIPTTTSSRKPQRLMRKTTSGPEHQDESEENNITVFVKDDQWKDNQNQILTEAESRYILGKNEMKTSIPPRISFLTHQGKVPNDKRNKRRKQHWSRSHDRNVSKMERGKEKRNDGLTRVRRKRKGSWRKCVKVNRRERVMTRCSSEGK